MMNGGEIIGNSASNYGGGVDVDGVFTMNGGTITDNSSNNGGGVDVYSGTFTMTGGEISGNTAIYYGGGVYVYSGTFTKQSGVIYGSDAVDGSKNTANGDDYGHAVYVGSSPAKRRNSTAGEGVILNSAVSGTAGGWETLLPSELSSLAEKLAWLASNAVDGNSYAITLNANESLEPQTLSYSGKKVDITLNGGDVERTVSLSSTGSLFTVDSGVTLTLGNNVTLQGLSSNTAGLISVNSGGTLEMNIGSKVTGNTKTSGYGGGVNVYSGTFTMAGGTISGNTASYGGGMFSNGTFTMTGGTISGNTASTYGGGVLVNSGAFTKTGGTIYGSNASASLKNTATSGDSYGHAVYVYGPPVKIRNSTAGTSVNLDSTVSGVVGGWENVNTGSVSISLQPSPNDPPLANTSLLANQSTQFSAGSGYSSYQWYWNGALISSATSSTYTLTANSRQPGIYELAVAVTTSEGELLSARCRITINAH
jgi:hypothetical protein